MVNNGDDMTDLENKSSQSDKLKLMKYESVRIYIKYSPNNTIINLTDIQGNSILCISAGLLGFTGARKGSLLAAKAVAEVVAKKAIELGCKQVFYFIKSDRKESREVSKVFNQFGLLLTKYNN